MWLHISIILGVFKAPNGIFKGPSYLRYLDTYLPL